MEIFHIHIDTIRQIAIVSLEEFLVFMRTVHRMRRARYIVLVKLIMQLLLVQALAFDKTTFVLGGVTLFGPVLWLYRQLVELLALGLAKANAERAVSLFSARCFVRLGC